MSEKLETNSTLSNAINAFDSLLKTLRRMPSDWEEFVEPEEANAIVAFMAEQKGGYYTDRLEEMNEDE